MPTRRPWLATAAAVLVAAVAACGSSAPTVRPSTPPPVASAATAAPTDAPTEAPSTPPLTPVPGDASGDPNPPPFNPGTTETEWGTILDAVPDDFPVYPGAEPAELPEAASGIWAALAPPEGVSSWYERTLEALGYTVDMGSPLEDGTRVAEIGTDLPECRMQVTFKPAAGSTMIIVLYGADCRPAGA
jgi:hypothetical protein